jgi:hypothetical protein
MANLTASRTMASGKTGGIAALDQAPRKSGMKAAP